MTRNWFESPGQDGTFWVTPFYTTAQWDRTSAQVTSLRNGTHGVPTGTINVAGNFAAPWYIGHATDPLVTVTDGVRTIHVHIPLGAVVETPFDSFDGNMGGTDATQPYLCWSGEGCTINTGSIAASGSVVSVASGLVIFDGSGPVMMDAVTQMGSPGPNAFGLIQDFELSQALANPNYVIPHMLAYTLDTSQVSPSAPAVWPLFTKDGSSVNTGIIPQGVTIGIPADVPRPAGKSRGFYLLWDCMQQFGAFFYNIGGTSAVNLSVFSQNSANSALVADIQSSWSAVVASLCILTNQSGVSTVKGFAPGAQYTFTPPPPLDLSPTGGYVTPSTFGAWYTTRQGVFYNTLGPLSVPVPTSSLTITTPPTQNTSSSFVVSGTLIGYTAPPNLLYRDDAGLFQSLPSGATVTATAYSFTHPPMVAGSHTVTVEDANNTAANVSTSAFQVTAPVATVIAPVAPTGSLVGSPFTLRATLSGYTAPPTVSFNDDGTGIVPLPAGSTVTTTQVNFVHPGLPTAGTHTTVVSDSVGTAGSVTYTVGTSAGSPSPNLSTISPGVGFLTDLQGVTWTIAPDALAVANGLEDSTSSNVVEMALVNGQIFYENSSAQWFSKTHLTDSWAGPLPSPLGQAHTIHVAVPVGTVPQTPFTVTGSLLNYAAAPSLTFSDDPPSPARSLPAGSVVTSLSYSFTHPGLPSGTHTLTISDGTTSATVSFSVATAGFVNLPAISGLTETISGLLPSTPYDIQVFATNALGDGIPSSPITASTTSTTVVAPSTPTGLAATTIAVTSVNLSWVASTTGTAPISYLVQWSPTGLNTWTSLALVQGTSAQVTGLASSTTYDFQVQASNSAGASAFDQLIGVTTLSAIPAVTWQTAGATPSIVFSPDALTAVFGGSSTAGAAPQSCVSMTSLASGKASFQVTLTALTQDISVGLANSNWVNGTPGAGGVNTFSTAFYPSTGTGSQPALSAYYNNTQILTPGVGTNGLAPLGDTAGAVVTVCVDRDNNLWWVQTPAMAAAYGAGAWNDSTAANPGTGAGGMPLSVAGAVFILLASDEGGATGVLNASPTASFIPTSFPPWAGGTLPATAPGQVTGVAGTPANTSVALSWAVPTGTPPLTYTVQSRKSGVGAFTVFGTTQATTDTVTGLSPATAYDFQVFATNQAGIGAVSATLTTSTTSVLSPPDPPTALLVSSATNTTLTATWRQPATATQTSFQLQFKKSTDGTYTNAPPWLESVNGAIVTTVGPQLIDSARSTFSIAADGKILINGAEDPSTANVVELKYWAHKLNQLNLAGNWFQYNGTPGNYTALAADPATLTPADLTFTQTVTGLVSGTVYNFQVQAVNSAGSSAFTSPPVNGTTSTVSSTIFTVSGGQILTNGSPVVFRGLAIQDSMFSQIPASLILQQFPGTNLVFISNQVGGGYSGAQPDAAYQSWVGDATNRGIVCVLSDYPGGQGVARSGADATGQMAWYARLAGLFAANQRVWWTTQNETSGDNTAMHQGIYNSVRGAGNSGIILMESQDGNPNTTGGLTASIYASMSRIAWNIHFYPWAFRIGTGNQVDFDNQGKTYVSLFQTFANSRDGVMPVIMGEGGNSTSGAGVPQDDTIIAGKFATVQAFIDISGQPGGLAGFAAWLYQWPGVGGDADTLVAPSGITDYGLQVAAGTASFHP